jgi:hypothetical protein
LHFDNPYANDILKLSPDEKKKEEERIYTAIQNKRKDGNEQYYAVNS